MIPMIDIMLVLLIIFMIVTPVITAGFQAKMPEGKNLESAPEESGDVLLGVDREGGYYLDPGTGSISPVSAEQLEDVLEQIYSARAEKIMYFRADADLEYGKIEDALLIARRAGVRVLAAVTDEKREPTLGRR
ncbi:MAG: biopolymer transporter ExbD [Gemmatimonadota bacterium]|nr:biopolymer transporter ExbD [Gemmatimonadota bacterium]